MAKVSPKRKLSLAKKRCCLFVKPPRTHNEDWNRMVWATFKPFVLLFVCLTIIFLIANLIYYHHKWSTPQESEKCEFRTCLKKKNSEERLEILVEMFRNQTLPPVLHHISLVGLFCGASILGNLLNEFTLSYYSAYGLSVIWIHEHYHNFRIILDSSAILYNLAHLTHILAAISGFAFAATVLDNKHKKFITNTNKKNEQEQTRVKIGVVSPLNATDIEKN